MSTWGESYPSINCKGCDTVVLVKWLMQVCSDLCVRHPERRAVLQCMEIGSKAFVDFFRLLYRNGLCLEYDLAQKCCNEGAIFQRAYSWMQKHCFHDGKFRFSAKPKLHYWHETLQDLHISLAKGCEFILSPCMDICEQDESFIGHVSRQSRRVSIRTNHNRTIQRYLLRTCLQFKTVHKCFLKD